MSSIGDYTMNGVGRSICANPNGQLEPLYIPDYDSNQSVMPRHAYYFTLSFKVLNKKSTRETRNLKFARRWVIFCHCHQHFTPITIPSLLQSLRRTWSGGGWICWRFSEVKSELYLFIWKFLMFSHYAASYSMIKSLCGLNDSNGCLILSRQFNLVNSYA